MSHLGLDKLSLSAPIHRARMNELLLRCTEAGIRILITFTYRSVEEQFKLYMTGRQYDPSTNTIITVNPSIVVTNALPGRTSHNVVTKDIQFPASMASDIIPVDDKGSPIWDTPNIVWLKIYDICNKKAGLDAYGDPWGRLMGSDKGHVEEPMWPVIMDSLGLMAPSFDISTKLIQLSQQV